MSSQCYLFDPMADNATALNIEVMLDTDHAPRPFDSSTRHIPLETIYAILAKLSPIEDKSTLASAMRVSLAINRMAASILYSQLEIFGELHEDGAYPPLISQGSQEVATGRGIYGRTVAQFVRHVVIFNHPEWVCLKMSEIDHLPILETVRIGESMAQADSLCPAPHTCKFLAASSPYTLTMAHNNKCDLDLRRHERLGLHTVSLMEPTANAYRSIRRPSPDPLAPPVKVVAPLLDRTDIPLIVIGPTESGQAVPAQLESRLLERHAAALRERSRLPGRTTLVGVFTRSFDAGLIIPALSRPEIDVTSVQIGLFTEAEHQACYEYLSFNEYIRYHDWRGILTEREAEEWGGVRTEIAAGESYGDDRRRRLERTLGESLSDEDWDEYDFGD